MPFGRTHIDKKEAERARSAARAEINDAASKQLGHHCPRYVAQIGVLAVLACHPASESDGPALALARTLRSNIQMARSVSLAARYEF
jgi:hypothetical protein